MTPRPRSHYLECSKCESCFKVAKDVTAVPAHKCWAADKEAVIVAQLPIWWFLNCGPGGLLPLNRDPGEYSSCDGTEWYFGERCPTPRPRPEIP